MTKIIITGSKGRMGQALVTCAAKIPELQVVGQVDQGDDLSAIIGKADVVIDFSFHSATLSVAEALPDMIHQVELTIHPEQPDKAKILSQRNEKIDDPKRYDGTVWYAGAILLVGELVE